MNRNLPPASSIGGLFAPAVPDAKGYAAPRLDHGGIPHNGTPGSREAAKNAKAFASNDRERVFVFIEKSAGVTRKQIGEALGIDSGTYCPRVWELIRDGRVKEVANPDGSKVAVLVSAGGGK